MEVVVDDLRPPPRRADGRCGARGRRRPTVIGQRRLERRRQVRVGCGIRRRTSWSGPGRRWRWPCAGWFNAACTVSIAMYAFRGVAWWACKLNRPRPSAGTMSTTRRPDRLRMRSALRPSGLSAGSCCDLGRRSTTSSPRWTPNSSASGAFNTICPSPGRVRGRSAASPASQNAGGHATIVTCEARRRVRPRGSGVFIGQRLNPVAPRVAEKDSRPPWDACSTVPCGKTMAGTAAAKCR